MSRLFTIILLTCSWSVLGQGFVDLASFDYFYGLNDQEYTKYNSMGLTLQGPIPLKNKDIVLTGFAIEGAGIERSNTTYQSRNLTFNAGYQKQLTQGRSIVFLTVNRFNGDAFALNSENYQFGLVGLYTYKKTEDNALQIGFYTNSEFMGQIVTPLFGVDWKINPKVRFFGVLPAAGTLSFKQHEKWFYGLHFFGIFQTYKQPDDGAFYLQRSINQLSLFSDFHLTEQLVFNIRVGYRLGSFYKRFAEGDKVDWALNLIKFGDDRTELDSITTNGLMLTMGLRFRFNLEN